METRGLSLLEQINIVEKVRRDINCIQGAKGLSLQQKAEAVFSKNKGFQELQSLQHAMNDASVSTNCKIRDPVVLSVLLWAPLVSVDVERSFSVYKYVLSDRRLRFTQENVKKHVLINYNSEFLGDT